MDKDRLSTKWAGLLGQRVAAWIPLIPVAISSVVAVYAGFFALDPDTGTRWFDQIGYVWIAAVFVAFAFLGLWCSRGALNAFFKHSWKRWEHLGALAVIGVASGYCIGSEPWAFHVVLDEPMLMATSATMAEHQRVFLPLRGYHLEDQYWTMDKFFGDTQSPMVDKRPILYPFWVSLLHVYRGFSWTHGNLLNNLLCPVFFGLFYLFLRGFLSFGVSCVSVLFVAALPLMPWVVNGAGMEMTMLVGFLLLCLAMKAYLQKPVPMRLSVLCLATVLVAQSRYEMAIFVVPTALAILLGWWKAKRVVVSWIFILTPLLFVPSAWQQRLFSRDPEVYQVSDALRMGYIHENHGPFSLKYIPSNLKATSQFFFDLEGTSPSNALLSAFGLVGLLAFARFVFGQERPFLGRSAVLQASALMGLGTFLTFLLCLSYAWGNMNKTSTCRFSLLFSVVGLMAFAWAMDYWKVRRVYLQAACVLTPLVALGLASQLKAHYYNRAPSFFHGALPFVLHTVHTLDEKPENAGALYLSELTYLTAAEHYNSLNTGQAAHRKARLAAFIKKNPRAPIYVFQLSTYDPKLKESVFLIDLEAYGFKLKPLKVCNFPQMPPYHLLHVSQLEGLSLTSEEALDLSRLPMESADLATRLFLMP